MKRLLKHADTNLIDNDKFEQEWENKFGPEQQREFDSFEEFTQWLKEVSDFEVSDNKTV